LEDWKEQIDWVLIRYAMQKANWTWIGVGLPSIKEMQDHVSSLIGKLLEDKDLYSIETGGFVVSRVDGMIRVDFILQEALAMEEDLCVDQS